MDCTNLTGAPGPIGMPPELDWFRDVPLTLTPLEGTPVRRPLSWLVRRPCDDSGSRPSSTQPFGLGHRRLRSGRILARPRASISRRAGFRGARVLRAPYASHIPAAGPHLQLTTRPAERSSTFSLALMSLGSRSSVSAASSAGIIFATHSPRAARGDRVRQSLTGSSGQAALERLGAKVEPRADRTNQTARHQPHRPEWPDVHHWVKGQDVSLSGELASSGSRSVRPETDIEIIGPPPAACFSARCDSISTSRMPLSVERFQIHCSDRQAPEFRPGRGTLP